MPNEVTNHTIGACSLKKNNFHAIRLSLAVLVIFSHCFPLYDGSEQSEPLMLWTGHLSFGRVAVDSFFIISGFLIAASWCRSQGTIDFLRKRIARIYPGFIVSSAFGSYLLAYWILRNASVFDYRISRFAWDCLWLQGGPSHGVFDTNPNHAMNGSLWSIPFEFWCYLGTMAIGLLGGFRNRHLVLTMFAISLLAAFVFPFFELQWVGGNILGRLFGWPFLWSRILPLYLAGTLAWTYRDFIQISQRWLRISLMALFIAAYFKDLWPITFPLAGGYALLYIAFTQRVDFSRLSQVGDFSYGTYLFAFPIQQLMVLRYKDIIASPGHLFFAATPVVLVLAVISWHLVEKPFLTRKRLQHE